MSDEKKPIDLSKIADFLATSKLKSPFTIGQAVPLQMVDEAPQAEVPELKPFVPTINLVTNDALVTNYFGAWSYDENTNVLTAEVSPVIDTLKLNLQLMQVYMNAGKELSPDLREYIMDYTIRAEKCITCTHFVPSAGMLENGAEQVVNWPYNKAKKAPQCSNPDIVGSDNFAPCMAFPNFSHCHGYTLNEWSGLAAAYVNDQQTMLVERRYFGSRVPQYRIGETIYTSREEATAALEQHAKELHEAGNVVTVLALDATSRNRLFDRILV